MEMKEKFDILRKAGLPARDSSLRAAGEWRDSPESQISEYRAKELATLAQVELDDVIGMIRHAASGGKIAKDYRGVEFALTTSDWAVDEELTNKFKRAEHLLSILTS